jgi:hypothetical protein
MFSLIVYSGEQSFIKNQMFTKSTVKLSFFVIKNVKFIRVMGRTLYFSEDLKSITLTVMADGT